MKIAIVGAGLIGLYVGARLIESGAKVKFFGRQRMKDFIETNGLCIDSYMQRPFTVSSPIYLTDPSQLSDCDLFIFTLKTTQMVEALSEIAPYLSPNTEMINLQNGIETKEAFNRFNFSHKISEGIVTFNVIQNGKGVLFQSTSGPIILDRKVGKEVISLFKLKNLEFRETSNIEGVKWSKLLLNLNNALNAISGLPIKAELENRLYRRIFAGIMDEAIQVAKKRNIRLESLTAVNPILIPTILRLPNFIFKRVAKKMISIDPLARSSMLIDLESRRLTEIGSLNLKICELAKESGLSAKLNLRISKIIREAESLKSGSPRLSANELWEYISNS